MPSKDRQTDRAGGSHIPKWFKIIRETESKKRGFQLGGPHLPISPLSPIRQDKGEVGGWRRAAKGKSKCTRRIFRTSPIFSSPQLSFPPARTQPLFCNLNYQGLFQLSGKTPHVQSYKHWVTAQRDRVTDRSQAISGGGQHLRTRTNWLGDISQVTHSHTPMDNPALSPSIRLEKVPPPFVRALILT